MLEFGIMFALKRFALALVANPYVWLVLVGGYALHWADQRGYARHEREASAQISALNLRITALNAAAQVSIPAGEAARGKEVSDIIAGQDAIPTPAPPSSPSPAKAPETALPKGRFETRIAAHVPATPPSASQGCGSAVPAETLARLNAIR